jgi:uroporphyrinogen-III synthase
LFRVAAEDNADEQLCLAMMKLAIGSVGPICTQVLRQYKLKPDIVPEHPKMGSLLAEVAASARRILAVKRAVRS